MVLMLHFCSLKTIPIKCDLLGPVVLIPTLFSHRAKGHLLINISCCARGMGILSAVRAD